jgi:protoheme IX farnesyltransferase
MGITPLEETKDIVTLNRERSRHWKGLIKDVVELTKPRIVSLLVFTGLASLIIAAHGVPAWQKMLGVLLGGALAAGGANSINMWFDQDIDSVMTRTMHRPVPAGRLHPNFPLLLGISLNLVAFALLITLTNALAASITLAASAFYVLIYTMWLKRTTTWNIVIGGAAGAAPPLVAFAAVTGTLPFTTWLLFLVIFLWTPPHFWSLALFMKDDYSKARVPMLPVIRGELRTKIEILLYSLILLPLTLVLTYSQANNPTAFVLVFMYGLVLVAFASMLMISKNDSWKKHMFLYSILYLALVFATTAAFSI